MAALAESQHNGPPLDLLDAEDILINPEPFIAIGENSPELIDLGHGLDIKRPNTPNFRSSGFKYEQTSFVETMRSLNGNKFAFGPGIIDAAFASRGYSRPDVLVFVVEDDGMMRLDTMVEYKTTNLQTDRKLRGFRLFAAYMRTQTDDFKTSMENAFGGTILAPIVVPEDRKITVEFASPRFAKDGATFFPPHLFPVRYSRITQPQRTPQAA